RVGTMATTAALVQSVTSCSAASCPAVQALFSHWPGSVTVADAASVVDAPAARPSTNAQATNPVSASTVPPPLALTKLRPSGRADSTCTSVNATVPGFLTVYVKSTSSPIWAARGSTELDMLSASTHGPAWSVTG